jgi:hypothetical protein
VSNTQVSDSIESNNGKGIILACRVPLGQVCPSMKPLWNKSGANGHSVAGRDLVSDEAANPRGVKGSAFNHPCEENHRHYDVAILFRTHGDKDNRSS